MRPGVGDGLTAADGVFHHRYDRSDCDATGPSGMESCASAAPMRARLPAA